MAELAKLTEAGCPIVDELQACSVSILSGESDAVPHRNILDSISDVTDRRFRFHREQCSFELQSTAGSSAWNLSSLEGNPDAVFTDEELQRATRAWAGDTAAAQTLRGEWSGELTVYLSRPFQAADKARVWRVIRSADVLVKKLGEYPWWRTRELIADDAGRVIVVIASDAGIELVTLAFDVASLDRLGAIGSQLPEQLVSRRAEVMSSSGAQVPENLALPEELEPREGSKGADKLRQALRPRADACAWAWLSNSTRAADGAKSAYLEFFGYRRRTFELGKAGYTGDVGQRAYKLYEWATPKDASPDRVLAIRQVVSIYEGPALPSAPEDVIRAAEPLYVALRAGEVAAVLESQRQARAIAIDAARESADAAQSAAKSAAERTIASLAAVAGVAVANATAVLSDKDARRLAIGIAILFGFLAIWALVVEGPGMSAAIKSYETDLPTIGRLLSPSDRASVLGMQALAKSKNAVRRVRISTFLVYAMGGLVSLSVAYWRFHP